MVMRLGRCIKFGECEKADSKEQVAMPIGATGLVCAECGSEIIPVPAAVPARKGPFVFAVATALIAVTFVASVFFAAGKKNTGAISPPLPAATQPAQQPMPAVFALCGPNAIWSRLGPDLAAGFLSSLGARSPTIHESAADDQTVDGYVNGAQLGIRIATHGLSAAYDGLRNGQCQVSMASRRIKSVEAVRLRSLGNMLSPSAEHVVGLDGIAIIVNAANTVAVLSIAQLKEIFTGRVTAWNAVGGSSGPIRVLAPTEKFGATDTFKSLVLDQAALMSGARRFEDSGALSAAVSADQNAIGFVGLQFIAQAKALRIASGGLAVEPNSLTIGRETYPLTRRLFFYTSPPQSSLVGKFVAFVQSDAGQRILNREGFFGSINSIATPPITSRDLPSGAPSGYRTLVDSLDQAGFNFYFNTGSDVLDNKALVDIGRLVEIVSNGATKNRAVILAGFADSTGSRELNLKLSEDRAKSVARELVAQRVRVKATMGFGQELPISDNATEAGREKNRRVEIFITR